MFNVYFITMLHKMATFNPNFKIILTVVTLSQLSVTVVHPMENLLPTSWYSVENGHYIPAILYYTLTYVISITSGFFCNKYLLIAIERTVAYKQRHTYERQGARLSIVCLMATMFVKLYREVKLAKFPTSVAESFEIKHTKAVLQYVRRLVSVFVALLIACGTGFGGLFYAKFVLGYREEDPESKVFVTFIFSCACIYNFVTTVYMIVEFPQLARIMQNDMPFLSIYNKVSPVPSVQGEHEAEIYFKQLADSWK
ncbi:unnamed protein product [Bursaphelenchus okinawaensis]|uniref:G_PROTEIN_RECEP_F1_2 domain-containing protein n=1 Tax=Bursaphelenchus okinawaensis TaxID=465554 RepID=A0A811KWY7_9BILA|nr:unnamed protein product [Bursaphelenchus okinawaensis]CAG9113082.1 unnamed protein product [Bursaphelenchus okinawaensis]